MQLNKKLLLTFIVLVTLLIILILYIQKNQIQKNTSSINGVSVDSSYDIIKPKFTINNENEKILITANEGNFVNNDQILLKNNVLFKSDKFKIFSKEVIFNKKKQTAKSDKNSIFRAKGTEIKSEGFDIIDQGNIIQFNGKTSLTLSK